MKLKGKVMERLERLMAEYGAIAVGTYFGLFFLVWAGFAAAIALGFRPQSATGTAGIVVASYLATKVTQPLRIAGALLLTPLIARLFRRARQEPKAPNAETRT